MTPFATLQQQHEALLARQDALPAAELRPRSPRAEQLLQDARQFVADAIAQSDKVTDPRERDLLRAYLRYWATFIYDGSGVFPKTDLRPADLSVAETQPDPPLPPDDDQPGDGPPRPALPGWAWALAVLGGVLLCAAATFFVLNLGRDVNGQAAGDTPVALTQLPPTTLTTPPNVTEIAPSRTPTLSPETGGNLPIDFRTAATIKPLSEVQAHTGGALAVAFNPQKEEVATAGADGHVRFWSTPNLAPLREISIGEGLVRTVDYSPYIARSTDPPLFLAGGNDRRVRVFDRESLQLFAEYVPTSGNSGFVFAARFSPDGRLFTSGHGDGVARLWDIASGTENNALQQGFVGSRLEQFASGGTAVFDVAYNDDGLTVALAQGGTANGVQVVDSSLRTPICALDSGPARAVAFSPGSAQLAAGLEDGRLLLVSVTPNGCRIELEVPAAHEGGVNDIAYSPGESWLVTGGGDGTIKIWSQDGELLTTQTTGAPVQGVAVNADSTLIASVDADGAVILWGIP